MSPHRSPRRLPLLLLLTVVLLGTVLARTWPRGSSQAPAAVDAGPPIVEPGPVGRAAYQNRLTEAAGQPIDAEELATLAREAAERLEAKLDDIAGEMGEDDWRPAFSRLAADHPADADAVLAAYREEVDALRAFLAEGAFVPLPASGVEVVEIANPIFRRYFSLAMYLDDRLAVTLEPPPDGGADTAGGDYLRNHCRVCIPPLVAHEVWPGHHVAYRRATVVPEGRERLEANRRNVVYHEGWALYAEWLTLRAGYYRDPASRLGAWRMLYLRAIRAWIDPALHLGTLSVEEAESAYRRDAGMTAEAARSEIARHLKDPVLKASYFIGLLQILELRRHQLANEGKATDAASHHAFHDRFLGEPRPIPRLASDVFGHELGSLSADLLEDLTGP